jgi:hypothetical protein
MAPTSLPPLAIDGAVPAARPIPPAVRLNAPHPCKERVSSTPTGQETMFRVSNNRMAGALVSFSPILTVSSNTAVSSPCSPRSWDAAADQLWLTLTRQSRWPLQHSEPALEPGQRRPEHVPPYGIPHSFRLITAQLRAQRRLFKGTPGQFPKHTHRRQHAQHPVKPVLLRASRLGQFTRGPGPALQLLGAPPIPWQPPCIWPPRPRSSSGKESRSDAVPS